MILVSIKTVPGLNAREPWQARSGRVKRERKATAAALEHQPKPAIPCSVLLTRVAPSSGVDDDNLSGSLKGVRDEIAAWIGVDDRKQNRVRYRYAQIKGPWGVRIEFGEPASGAQLELLGVPVVTLIDPFAEARAVLDAQPVPTERHVA